MDYVAKRGTTALGIIGTSLGGLAVADLAAVKAELKGDIKLEAERRCCADNSIVTYTNATFYPKMVADVTTGTGTTAQTTYNPIPNCGGCCKNN